MDRGVDPGGQSGNGAVDTLIAAPGTPALALGLILHAHWPRGDMPSRLMSKWERWSSC